MENHRSGGTALLALLELRSLLAQYLLESFPAVLLSRADSLCLQKDLPERLVDGIGPVGLEVEFLDQVLVAAIQVLFPALVPRVLAREVEALYFPSVLGLDHSLNEACFPPLVFEAY